MTIDEAIEHAEECANADVCGSDCRAEHAQLAEWLRELKQLREVEGAYLSVTHRIAQENAKLRACLGDGCADCAIGMGEYADSLCDPLKSENAKLREQSERLFDKTLEVATENATLRELVETMRVDMREMLDIIDKSSDTRGYCRYYGECLDAAEGIMRDLGIEVDG